MLPAEVLAELRAERERLTNQWERLTGERWPSSPGGWPGQLGETIMARDGAHHYLYFCTESGPAGAAKWSRTMLVTW